MCLIFCQGLFVFADPVGPMDPGRRPTVVLIGQRDRSGGLRDAGLNTMHRLSNQASGKFEIWLK